jgi:hypothetical protein
MPKTLVIGAIIAVIVLVVLMSWLNRRSLDQTDQPQAEAVAPAPAMTAPNPAASPSTPAVAQGAVVLTATAPAWIQVTDQGKSLFQGELQPGQSYTVPPTATAPLLKAGKPEALTVAVGSTSVPQVGPTGKVTTVSLLPSDLLKAPSAPPPAATAPAAPAARQRPRARTPAQSAPPAGTPAEQPPTTNTAL